MTKVYAKDWMLPYKVGVANNPEPSSSFNKSTHKFVIANIGKDRWGFEIPKNLNTQYVSDFKEAKTVQDYEKLYKPVTIYSDDSEETKAGKFAVAQKRQTAITMGGFMTKNILTDSPKSFQEYEQKIIDIAKSTKEGVNVGNVLKAVGVGAGIAALAGAGYAIANRNNGGSKMGLGTTYAQIDEYLGGFLPGGITPTTDNALEAQAGIVKRYSTPNGTLYRFANGRMGMVSPKTGLLKTWKPYHPIVIGKRPKIGQLLRVIHKAQKWKVALNRALPSASRRK